MNDTASMPAVFIGHGSPMNTLDDNRYTRAWHELGRAIARPRAILAVSAHWYINASAVTAMAEPRTIHDFFGFPDELFAVEYPAPGDPQLAADVAEVAKPLWVGQDVDSWGIDHGTWSVLAHMYPEADVPVVQLSIDATRTLEDHIALGAALAPLRERGVLIVASGNVVHNLRRLQWDKREEGADWAHEFDEAAQEIMGTRPGEIAALSAHPRYDLAVPTPDHFLPLLYLAGLADVGQQAADVLIDGYAMGSLSMTSYLLPGS
jgi:4,5-DOPA dioxygenase extradiol